MRKENLEKLGLAAAILLLPGGFILGGTLAARAWRRKRTERANDARAPGERPASDPSATDPR